MPPQSKSLSYAHVGMNVHISHRYRNWGTDTGCMYLPNTFELILHCVPSKKHILYHSHIVLVIKIHGNIVVTSLFLTIKVICASLYWEWWLKLSPLCHAQDSSHYDVGVYDNVIMVPSLKCFFTFRTPLYIACKFGYLPLVKQWIATNAGVNETCTWHTRTDSRVAGYS